MGHLRNNFFIVWLIKTFTFKNFKRILTTFLKSAAAHFAKNCFWIFEWLWIKWPKVQLS